jgi:hypothetical protein
MGFAKRPHGLVLNKNAVMDQHIGDEIANQYTVISDADSFTAPHV